MLTRELRVQSAEMTGELQGRFELQLVGEVADITEAVKDKLS